MSSIFSDKKSCNCDIENYCLFVCDHADQDLRMGLGKSDKKYWHQFDLFCPLFAVPKIFLLLFLKVLCKRRRDGTDGVVPGDQRRDHTFGRLVLIESLHNHETYCVAHFSSLENLTPPPFSPQIVSAIFKSEFTCVGTMCCSCLWED